jgi:hypothetical protein
MAVPGAGHMELSKGIAPREPGAEHRHGGRADCLFSNSWQPDDLICDNPVLPALHGSQMVLGDGQAFFQLGRTSCDGRRR